MGRCIICQEETDSIVRNNIGGEDFLCEYCQSRFEQCEVCGEYYLGEDLAEYGICENCYDGEE